MRISDWSSDVCSSDLRDRTPGLGTAARNPGLIHDRAYPADHHRGRLLGHRGPDGARKHLSAGSFRGPPGLWRNRGGALRDGLLAVAAVAHSRLGVRPILLSLARAGALRSALDAP